MGRILANPFTGSMRPLLNQHSIFFSTFFIWLLLTFQYLKTVAWRDPGSVFFDPSRAFDKAYSLAREQESNAYIDEVVASNSAQVAKAGSDPSFCVGIATVQRAGARYFRSAVGSLLEGLDGGEREDFELILFIANVDPKVHSAYNETWLSSLSDQVLTYKDAPASDIAILSNLEENDRSFETKPILDYVRLLDACLETKAPYIIILEDDVLAADGWYHRTKMGVHALERKANKDETLYLRLFYNERLMGWNSELWLRYTIWSVWIEAVVALTLYALWRYSSRMNKFLTFRTNFAILALCTPLCIGLYFAAGRLTVSPLPVGINRMDTFGCCSQAFLYPRAQIPELVKYWESEGHGMIDTLTEQYANAKGLPRYALTPSVFQHVGTKSSKWDRPSMWNRNGAQNIWNWSFERFNSEKLRAEHEAVLRAGL